MTAGVSRRSLVVGATAAFIARPAIADETMLEPRELRLYEAHTGESWRDYYHNGEGYIRPAWDSLNWLMRDHYEHVPTDMDPGVFDILWRLQNAYRRATGNRVTVNIHSAFRTEATNERLRREGAAQNSFHKVGQAIDVSVQGFGIYFLADHARAVGAGGVGIYWRSQFAHLDTGPSRFWYQQML